MEIKNLHRAVAIHPLLFLAIHLFSFSQACSLSGGGAAATLDGSVAATVENPADRGPAPTPLRTAPAVSWSI